MYQENITNIKKINTITKGIIQDLIKEKYNYLENNSTESEINAHPHSPYNYQGDLNVDVANYHFLDEFKEMDLSEKKILHGKYAIQLLGAGAATRLGKGPMFTLKFSELLNSESYSPITLGERHIIQYKIDLINLAQKHNISSQDALKNQFIIVHLNESTAKECINVFLENNFFGFDNKKIVFLIQSTFPAYKIQNQELIESTNKYPYGHGHTLLQLNTKQSAFIIDENNEIEILELSVIDYLKSFGVEILSSHRINDLTKIVKDSISVKKVNFALNQIKNGANIVVELVGNPNNQKGGKWLQWKENHEFDHAFLLESLNAKNTAWSRAFEELEKTHFEKTGEGIPYNAFRLMYNLDELSSLIEEGLTPSLREREEGLTLEITTGDITHLPQAKSVGFQLKDEIIHDFKSLDNLEEAKEFIEKQESNSLFKELIKESN